jgi:hypothetical protein
LICEVSTYQLHEAEHFQKNGHSCHETPPPLTKPESVHNAAYPAPVQGSSHPTAYFWEVNARCHAMKRYCSKHNYPQPLSGLDPDVTASIPRNTRSRRPGEPQRYGLLDSDKRESTGLLGIEPLMSSPRPVAIMPEPHTVRVHLNVMLTSMPMSSKWSLTYSYIPTKTVWRATCLDHLILFDLITLIFPFKSTGAKSFLRN